MKKGNVYIKYFLVIIAALIMAFFRIRNKDQIKMVITGQSLIKVDPRKHWKNPFKTVVPVLKKADVAFTNFEMAVDENCGLPKNYNVVLGKPECKNGFPGNTNRPHAVNENVMEYLSSINFKLMSLSNNHAWDLGNCGIKATIKAAEKYGVVHAGTGLNIKDATDPGVINVKGVKIALIAATTSKDKRSVVLAGQNRPGVNGVWTGWKQDWERNINAVKEAKNKYDFVVFYQHFQIDQKDAQGNGKYEHKNVNDKFIWQEEFAKAVIDAGADMYIAHGDRIFDGVEIYKGKPIFRQFGGFCYQGLKKPGMYDEKVWQGLLGKLVLKNKKIIRMEFLPVSIDEGTFEEYGKGPEFFEKRGFPTIVKNDLGLEILKRFKKKSEKYGAKIEIEKYKAVIDL